MTAVGPWLPGSIRIAAGRRSTSGQVKRRRSKNHGYISPCTRDLQSHWSREPGGFPIYRDLPGNSKSILVRYETSSQRTHTRFQQIHYTKTLGIEIDVHLRTSIITNPTHETPKRLVQCGRVPSPLVATQALLSTHATAPRIVNKVAAPSPPARQQPRLSEPPRSAHCRSCK